MRKNHLNFKLFVILSLITTWVSLAQEITIRGNVLDETGEPIPGVNILIKNTTKGTATDFDGKFTIAAKKGDILTFSYLGYAKQDILINTETNISITLVPDNRLDEIVVVGYGTQKKSVVTGAISGVKQSELEDLPITRVEQTLQGRVSGITIAANSGQPGSSSTVRVRGITTLGNNEPLWVVDGVVVDSGGIGFLNQSDIASVEVLKDAASQAIYGARAATGVILITTKKGKSGKISVNYNGYTGTSSAARKLDLLNASQYATLLNEKSVAGGGNLIFSDPQSYGEGTDWQSAIFNDSAKRTSHEVSLSGGNNTSTFYASFGYLDQEGIVMSNISNYLRKNIRLNSTHKISDKITFGQSLGYSNEKNVGIGNTNSEFGGPLSSAINLDPITPIVETDPILANQAPYTNNGIWKDANGNPYGISTLVAQEMSNPLAYEQTLLGNYGWSDNFVGNAYLEFEPIEGLKFKSTLGGKLAYWGYDSYTPVSYLNAATITTQNNISRGRNKGFGWNLENIVSYSKEIKNHNFNLLVGQGVYVDNITTGENVTYFGIPVDNYKDASFNFSVPTDQITASAYTGNEHRVTSLFSRLTYNFDEKYLFTAIVRRDGSSRFGSNNKYGFFPSFSAGWVPSKENFWVDNDIVTQLKIRGGYGVTGNDNIGDFQYLSTIGGGRNYTVGTSGSVTIGNSPNAPSNPDLKWEETSQLNIGFDARLFDNISVAFDWYKKETTGILQSITIPGYVGAIGSPTGNVADMENKGIDLEIGYNKQFNEVNFSINGNVSYLENEVTFLGNGVDFLSGGATIQSSTYPITRTQIGQPVNSFYGFKTNGIFQNQEEINNYVNSAGTIIQPNAQPGDFKWVDLDDDGDIDSDDRDFLGSSIPKFTYGFTLNLDYKNFDLLVFGQGAAGNKIFQGLRRLDVENANYQTSALGRWVGEGTSNTFPRLTTNDTNNNFSNPSDFYLEDGDYFRIKTLQVGYTLPSDVSKKYGVSKLRIYLTAENLFTFTKYSGYDPEIGGGIFGIDRGYYPQAKTNQIGINLQF
ncbi:SusC/RagA family TonB-linked outer membrane protein [Polaribacter reichenbachii]|uniref:SusC/RagA family TonB-linked outer membrane protein n=1 Tax=Polaribacter reichenbachii TaxID=996801 RepID=A0A1B8U4M5_9FLAO|nr:TonB-dependent receptor [Polaribacter reichenbachii]APZ44836.1 SusC/RagA family TonB-linked outer membrane protein [Polaribacter reichenbachii]AUC18700.1 SusC/RagA family TonB-linked outer membrane protein [Polaribacter reichenbachii]OBY66813.1 SusC/RagA family TonB-linked outer membrane protein [Polaribacter reichenbachii]